ncbi:MAG: LON peptidase substrate-binding domain-containing protein [Chloroflexota bacterium]
MDKIGLFPLSFALFPESVYPLHIFEDRYKALINDCLDKKKDFGIVLSINSKIYDIGCTAEISDVIKIYPDGKMDILIVGKKKFKIENFNDGEKPYFVADIEFVYDDIEPLNDELLLECLEAYNQIVDKIKNVKIEKIAFNSLEGTKTPSYFIAQKSGLNPEQKQYLLEINTENGRLEMLFEHLSKLLPIVNEVDALAAIQKNNGYYKPKFFNY